MNIGKEYYEGGFEDPQPQLLKYFDEITKMENERQIEQNSAIIIYAVRNVDVNWRRLYYFVETVDVKQEKMNNGFFR